EPLGIVEVDNDVTEARRLRDERDRALEAERAARATLERAQRRTLFLAAASAVLATSLDYESTLDRVARLAVPDLADWCVVDLAEPDEAGGTRLRRIPAAHAGPAKAARVRR